MRIPTARLKRSTRRGDLVYSSHKLTTWADLWTPDGNWQAQYDLVAGFQAKLTTEFIAWQADLVREYARDDEFVTTCISYERPTVDDANLTRAHDVTAGNPQPVSRHAGRARFAQHQRGCSGLDDVRCMEPFPLGRPDVRL